MMQKLLSVSALFAALFVSISCQKEIIGSDGPEKEKVPVIVAEIEKPFGTKTCMDGTLDAPKIYWQMGDEIKIFFGKKPDTMSAVYRVVSVLPEDRSKCVFEYVSGYVAQGTDWLLYAYYPASDAEYEEWGPGSRYSSNPAVKVTAQKVQQYVAPENTGDGAGTFGVGAFPMIAKRWDRKYVEDTLKLTFQNVFGILQLNLKADAKNTSVKKIDVCCNSSVCGPVNVNYSYQDSMLYEFDVTRKQVTLSAAGGGVALSSSGNGTAFYIAIPGGVAVKRIAVTTNDGFYCKDVSKADSNAVIISRSRIKNLSACTVGGKFTKITYPEATYVNPVMVEGSIYAPVNCGFKEGNPGFNYGKLYQWNRKYGQGRVGLDESGPSFWGGPVKLDEGNGDSYKDYFFTIGAGNCWYDNPTPQTSDTWSDEYNPCPENWGVPAMLELYRLENLDMELYTEGGTLENQRGLLFGVAPSQLFLPFVRKRFENGVIDTTDYKDWGDTGSYWSKTGKYHSRYIDAASAERFIIYEKLGAYDQMSVPRSTGCAVRCVYTGEL